jgi:dipeptidyl aminopeptidase/acylaminoacyl peptidase
MTAGTFRVQAWLIRPAGFDEAAEAAAAAGGSAAPSFPLAVVYHGGPQGSTGDSWQYRWNLQSYASAGCALTLTLTLNLET